MNLESAGLSRQPFPTHGKPIVTHSYASKEAALDVVRTTCEHPTGLSLLQGPSLSGKSTIIRCFVEDLPDECAVAIVDGKGLNTANFLVSMLRQYGYEITLSSTTELLGLVRMFALQQAASRAAPLLIVENAHALNPSALRALSELAELNVRRVSALKIVLASDRSMQALIDAPAMQAMATRLIHNFHLRPMNRDETREYIHAKLSAGGSEQPSLLFPEEVCEDIWRAAGGWPGIVDRIALLALAQSDNLPVSVASIEHPVLPTGTWSESGETGQPAALPHEPPRLIVTNNGSVMNDTIMQKSRVLIGRSAHNDITIDSRFISRHHTLLVRHGSATFLMDLNSKNGTFVNSQRVSNYVLVHEDVITVGHHRIKFYDPWATKRGLPDGLEFTDTTVMKSLEDMRNLLAEENMALLSATSENLPTIST